MKNTEIAFLVLSCDKYSDLWEPYAQLFNCYWQDCPFNKYFATNQISFNEYGFQSILTGRDKSWSASLFNTLIQLENRYKYVLITLEDLFIIKTVKTAQLIETLDAFIKEDGNFLKLYSQYKPRNKFNKYFRIIKKGGPYRQTCVSSLWKISTLKELIDLNENAWEFEKKGVYRSYKYDGFYCANINHFKLLNTVVKGKWVLSNLKKVRKLLPNLIVERDVFNKREDLKFKIKVFLCYFYLLLPLPMHIYDKIGNIAKKIID